MSGSPAPYVRWVLPDAFGSQKTLARLNVAAVAFALAACTGATFGAVFQFPGGLVALPTFFCGLLWAAVLRIPHTLGRSGLRWGWLASLPLAALNGGLACGVLFVAEPNAEPASGLVGIVLGATVGVLFWGPALTVTLLCFGVPIAWAQRLAARGLAGTERGERIVGAVCAVLGALACVVAHEGMGVTAHGIDHSDTQLSSGAGVTQLAGATAFVLGTIAVALATLRERRRATFVAQVEAGAVPRFRIDHAVEGKILVRIESQGRGAYRVADYEREVCLLDDEGAATRTLSSERGYGNGTVV